MPKIPFTIDAKLLRELGERLVGKPSIALGELVKNSYDADAERVDIRFDKSGKGIIVVSDNGHGMTFNEFKVYWMRIGSTHKEKWHYSPKYKRILTGQKGVGRLAVQFLAKEMILTTVSQSNSKERLRAFIRWEDAIKAGDLIKATAEYKIEHGNFRHGTEISLKELKHNWTEKDFKELANDLWILVPPFKAFKTEHGNFKVNLTTTDKTKKVIFKDQMAAFLNAYEGKIIGKNVNGLVNVSLIHENWRQIDHKYEISKIPGVHIPKGKELKKGELEIRIYRLIGRQPFGIKVDDLRNYMDDFHGVHIYDAGFHLPHYGPKGGDWLGISDEQARRIGVSDILPKDYQVEDGLTRLPGLRRILGIVKINTSEEDGLEIAITRDRLIDTKTFRALREMIRYALHLYAMEDQKYNLRRSSKKTLEKLPSGKVETVDQVIEKYQKEIPKHVYDELKEEVRKAIEAKEEKESIYNNKISFLGAFATAGISSLAYHHEIQKQLRMIDDLTEKIEEMIVKKRFNKQKLNEIKTDLKEWVGRAKQLEALFGYYGDADIITDRECFGAREVLEKIKEQLSGLLHGVKIINDVPEDVILPEASLVEWGAIFQNVILNAYNAVSMMENPESRKIQLLYREEDNEKAILVQDTGIGVELETSEELFEPFKRKIQIPPERKALGYGGSGIGLTIVRIISERIGCRAIFIESTGEYKTAFKLYWREKYE